MSWDGKGKNNVYLCERCGHGFVSRDVDAGVTPMITSCINDDCKGNAVSLFYKVPQEWLAKHNVAVEWYKPVALDGLPAHSIEHVQKGGLLSRKTKV